MKNDSAPCCCCAFTAVVLVQLSRLEVSMGALADAWKTIKQELEDLKAQNAALQAQMQSASSPVLDDSDKAALVDLEAAAAAVTPPPAPATTPAAAPTDAPPAA